MESSWCSWDRGTAAPSSGDEHFLHAAGGGDTADGRGGEEGQEKCLSQHKPLPSYFQGSCCHPSVAPGSGAGLPREPRPAPPEPPRPEAGARGLTPTDAVFLRASPVSRSEPHQEPISWEALEGTLAFLRACSAQGTAAGPGFQRQESRPLLQQPPDSRTSPVPREAPPSSPAGP